MKKLILTICILLSLPFQVKAQQTTTLFFPGISDVVKASGFIYQFDRTTQINATWKFDQTRDGTFVTLRIPRGGIESSLVSGAIVSEQQGLIMGPLTFADLSDPRALVPMCDEARVPPEMAEAQNAVLVSLSEIRQRRVDLARKKIDTLATPNLIARLQKLESGFGFSYNKPLTTDLPPEELSARLDELYHAIQRYKLFRR